MKLGKFDLNLFIALDALLSEQSVSGAAERLGITQPAMSQILSKLRTQYNDPIVVRQKNQLELTSFAREITGPVREMIHQMDTLINFNEKFDPLNSEHQFKIILEDAIQTAISAALYETVSQLAPKVSLYVLRNGGVEELSKGHVDLILSHHELHQPFHSELVCTTPFVSITRLNHPIASGDFDLQKFIACDHVAIYHEEQVIDSIEEEIDRQLHISGLRRNKPLKISSYVAAKKIVEHTDLIATIPASFATFYASDAKLMVFPSPLPLTPTPIYIIWHEQSDWHPAHRWFRTLLRDLIRAKHEDIPYGALFKR